VTWGTWPASLHKRFAAMLSFVVTRRMLNESIHLEYALRKYGDASFNADSQSDLTKLPQISVACRDLGVGPRTGYLTPPVQRLVCEKLLGSWILHAWCNFDRCDFSNTALPHSDDGPSNGPQCASCQCDNVTQTTTGSRSNSCAGTQRCTAK
jgi:hypothetical protein